MSNQGFGANKSEAISLLKRTIDILESYDIKHLLISGTLLGYVRHNDFIPWDDDIDLLVDDSIIQKLDIIAKENQDLNIFIRTKHRYDSIKICFRDSNFEIPINDLSKDWKENSISESDRYCWPFIDLFTFQYGPGVHNCMSKNESIKIQENDVSILNLSSGCCIHPFRVFSENEISFFHNEWQISEFFPLKQVDFLGTKSYVPKNPDYFLSINYGKDYMTNFKKSNISHKQEKLT